MFLIAYSHSNGARLREDIEGVDDGFGPFNPSSPAPPTNGEPRHTPFPPSPSPSPRRPGPGGYTPVPSGGAGAVSVARWLCHPEKYATRMDLCLQTYSTNITEVDILLNLVKYLTGF